MLENGQSLRRERYIAEAATCRGKREDVVDRAAGKEHLDHQLGSQIFEQHGGCLGGGACTLVSVDMIREEAKSITDLASEAVCLFLLSLSWSR